MSQELAHRASEYLPAGAETIDDQWMTLVRQLMQRPDFSIEMLERILALRSKERHDRALEAFNMSFAACQARVTKVEKNKPNPVFHSRYATIEAMYDAVWPAVVEAGFAWKVSAISTPPGWADNIVMFEGTLSKGIIKDTVQLPVDRGALVPEGPKGNRPAMTVTQAIGALTTYMRKYLLGLMFNLVTAEDVALDNDGNRRPAASDGKAAADPLDEPNGTLWLRNFLQALEAATTLEEVQRVNQHPFTVKALAKAPTLVKTQITDALNKAFERLAIKLDKPASKRPTDLLEAALFDVERLTLPELEEINNNAWWTSRLGELFPPDSDQVWQKIEARKAELARGKQ